MPRFILLLLALLSLAPPAFAQDRVVTEADGTRTLVTEVWVPAAPDAVWPLVGTADGWKDWAAPHVWANGNVFETSYKADARQGDPANIQHRIVIAQSSRQLSFRTLRTPPDFPYGEAFLRVTNSIDLIPESGGTRIRLTGAGFPAGTAGDALLTFFRGGNRVTLDKLAARAALTPLDFLAGHCWRGTLPNGDLNMHCFTRADGVVQDMHEVLRGGAKVYGGDTVYRWDGGARVLRFTYLGMDGSGGSGTVRPDGADLDFGTSEYTSGSGKVAISTRWVRLAPNAYEARDTSPTNAKFNRTTKYTRVD